MMDSSTARVRSQGRRLLKQAAATLLPASMLVTRGSGRRRQVALTFDDGPMRETKEYLRVLADHDVHASFFVVGAACRDRGKDVDAMLAAGHEVASHGFSHRTFSQLSPEELRTELVRTKAYLPPELPGTRLVRPPRGDLSPAALLTCAAAGLTTVLWSVDSEDWRLTEAHAIRDHVLASNVGSGDIVLLHEGQQHTLDALPAIIEHLLDANYELVTVSELLA